MQRLYVPSLGPTDWRRLLADPETQWERYKSALEMAVCWEFARALERGLPPEVAAVLDTSPDLRGATLLIGIPEHKVPLPGGGHPSQNDLWAVLRVGESLVSMTIEAKAGEKLDNLVRDWLPRNGEPSRKPERLAALQKELGVLGVDVAHLRYQLLHRSVSALLEAKRFGAQRAVMLVQSFNSQADELSWQDFTRFAELMGANYQQGRVAICQRPTAIPLYLGWVTSEPADLTRLSAAM